MIHRRRRHCSSSDGSDGASVVHDYFDGANGGGYCKFNRIDRDEDSGAADVQEGCSDGGRSTAQSGVVRCNLLLPY